ncbi:MAG: Na/Pi symporter, partial [Lachnospiraceae bacterium]|nr:Na/Pi symporter [Lachnospiraceae bacterium]
SSATIAVLQNFASQAGPDGGPSILGLTGAIPSLRGDNSGTTITALLASVGQSKDAKRTAVAHSLFNISGALLFIWFVKPYAALIQSISPSGAEIDVISRQIANAHTIFNITMTLIWIGLLGFMVKLVMKIIPDGKAEKFNPSRPIYLDRNVIAQPAAALRLVAKEVLRCADMVKGMLLDVNGALGSGEIQVLENVKENGGALDALQTEINDYLSELFSSGSLTEQQAAQTARLLCVLSDGELKASRGQIEQMYAGALAARVKGDRTALGDLLKDNEKILNLDVVMREQHMQRVRESRCKKELTVPFTRVLNCIDRMGNSCVNLAEGALRQMSFTYFMVEEK